MINEFRTPFGTRIVEEKFLNWEAYAMSRTPYSETFAILGKHSYSAFVYTLLVKPNILETDPGPLDAGVT